MATNFNKIGQFMSEIAVDLENYESAMRSDLGNNRGGKTSYIQQLNEFLEITNRALDAVRREQAWDSMLISKCEKNKDQLNRLLDIARGY